LSAEAKRRYELLPADHDLRYVAHQLVCDVCSGAYDVRGVVGSGAKGLRSSPASIHQQQAGWPCSCADVAAGARVQLPAQLR
jgi:hypothetical protein